MSQSSENNVDNFEVRQRTEANQEEASISGGMLVFHVTEPANQGSANLVPIAPNVVAPTLVSAPMGPNVAAREEAAYQGIMASLPTFVKKHNSRLRGEQLYLPHIEEKSSDPNLTPDYTFTDEAMLVKACLDYDKEFNPEAIGDPPTWGPAAPHTTTPRAPVVDLESSATVSDQGVVHPDEGGASRSDASFPPSCEQTSAPVAEVLEMAPEEVILPRKGKAATTGPSLPDYDGRYLDLPHTIPPNLEVTSEAPWKAHKFHYHAMKPLVSKKAMNGAHVLGRRADHLARANNQSFYQVDILKKKMADKNLLLKKEEELTSKGSELEGISKTVSELDTRIKDLLTELEREKAALVEAQKSWVVKKADLQKTWADKKTEMQARYEKLERANIGDIMRMTEAFKKEKETTLASVAAEAKVDRVRSCKKILRDFMGSPNYEDKVGCECVAYLSHLVTHCLSVDAPHPHANEGEAKELGEEEPELPGESRSPPA
ncbi:hypothetical protein LIER_14828 [Lithospermum erythrorhizon]|uniref:Uncharacterized protein n=1 Tax=Lithospermum erythrorhizon TaxID=34254 RepID=A0AAV3Q2Y1_LITER